MTAKGYGKFKKSLIFADYKDASTFAKAQAIATQQSMGIRQTAEGVWEVTGRDVDWTPPQPTRREVDQQKEDAAIARGMEVCYHCKGSGGGDSGHLCTVCQGRGYL